MAAEQTPRGAGIGAYLKEAFLFRWNLLFFLGGTAAAALMPMTGVLLPLVAAGELTYLAGLLSVPRFRAAIDAKVHAAAKGEVAASAIQPRRRTRHSTGWRPRSPLPAARSPISPSSPLAWSIVAFAPPPTASSPSGCRMCVR